MKYRAQVSVGHRIYRCPEIRKGLELFNDSADGFISTQFVLPRLQILRTDLMQLKLVLYSFELVLGPCSATCQRSETNLEIWGVPLTGKLSFVFFGLGLGHFRIRSVERFLLKG